jgi:hypothetical protein
MDGEPCYFDPGLPNPVTELLKRQRLSHTENDLERLRRLRDTTTVETRELIDTLMSLIQSLQARLEALERQRPEPSESFLDIPTGGGRATPVPGGSLARIARYPSLH